MARPKKIQDGKRVSVVLSNKQLKWVEHMARKISVREKKTITVSEAIRMAVEAAYPPPKQMDEDLFS